MISKEMDAAAMQMMYHLWGGKYGDKFTEFYGLIPYINDYMLNIPKCDSYFLIECNYKCHRHDDSTKIIVSKCEQHHSDKKYQKVVNMSHENLNILMTNILLKFDNIIIEKQYEST